MLNKFVYLCELSFAIDSDFCILPTWLFDDFMEQERQYEQEQEKKHEKILEEVFKMPEFGR